MCAAYVTGVSDSEGRVKIVIKKIAGQRKGKMQETGEDTQ
jgi:hypothetical protein